MHGSSVVSGEHRSLGIRRPLLLRTEMVDFERRGFRTRPESTRAVLEAAAGAFLSGFNAELATRPADAPGLASVPPARRGFAAEGAGMAAALLDTLNPVRGRRLASLRAAYDEEHHYLIQVGVGWAMAKLRRSRIGALNSDAPLTRWLAYDGLGFCQGFFAGPRRLRRWYSHARPCPDTCAIRFQGFGRHLWFRECGDPAALAAHVARLPADHHGDAWSGIGLAATYAGGVEPDTYGSLRDLAGAHRAALAQGSAFAAEARLRSGHTPPHTPEAVHTLAGVPMERAAEWTWRAREGLDHAGAGADDFARWRLRIQQQVTAGGRR